MSIQDKLFVHKDPTTLNYLSAYFGVTDETIHDAITLSAWSSIATTASDIGNTAVTNTHIVQLRLKLDNKTFIIPIYQWSTLIPQAADTAISTGNGTAIRCYEEDGNEGIYVLVGRSDRNVPLLQQGAGLNPSGSVRVELYVVERTGGPIDRLLESTGQRQLIAMQCDQDARPNPPPHGTDLRHNGRDPAASTLSTGEVWWPSGNRIRSLTTKTWFAFGEAVYNNLIGIWEVVAAWYILDSSDRTNIQFARNWNGPWGTDDYIVGQDRYARIRRSDGSYIVRFIGTDGAGHDNRWIPLTEQYINNAHYGYEPFAVRTNFEFHPSEWNHLRFEWSWEDSSDDIDGVTYYRKVSTIVPASDIVGSPMKARTATSRITSSNATSWTLVANSEDGMHAIRQAGFPSGLTGWTATLQYESSSTSEHEPITHIRIIDRGTLSTNGWLRTYVI